MLPPPIYKDPEDHSFHHAMSFFFPDTPGVGRFQTTDDFSTSLKISNPAMDAAKVSRIKAPRKELPQHLWRQDVAVTFEVTAKMVTDSSK